MNRNVDVFDDIELDGGCVIVFMTYNGTTQLEMKIDFRIGSTEKMFYDLDFVDVPVPESAHEIIDLYPGREFVESDFDYVFGSDFMLIKIQEKEEVI